MRRGLLVVAALAIAACGSAQPSSPSAVSPNPGQACALTTEPGPADEPDRDGRDLLDMTDQAGGRWRLCLEDPLVASAEGTLWCVWAPDRSTLLELSPPPLRIGAMDYETAVSLRGNQFEFHAMDLSGTIANYEPAAGVPTGESPDEGRSGTLMFEVRLVVDPESGPPPDVSPGYAGTMTWKCADPPAPSPT